MFRPLRHALDQVVTAGYLRLIDAKGCAFAFGDLNGAPVVARIADARTERRLFFNPALALGEAYMDGRLVMDEAPSTTSSISSLKSRLCPLATLGPERGAFASRPLARQFNPQPRAGAMSRIITTRRRPSTSCSSTATGNIPAPISSATDRRSKRPSSPRSAISPPSSPSSPACGCSTSARAGAGWRSTWPRPPGAEVIGVTLSSEQLQGLERARGQREGLSDAVRFELSDYREVEGTSTASSRSACSSMSASAITAPSSQVRDAARPTTASPCSTRSAAPTARRHQPLDRQIHLPRRLHPGAVGDAAGDRARRA